MNMDAMRYRERQAIFGVCVFLVPFSVCFSIVVVLVQETQVTGDWCTKIWIGGSTTEFVCVFFLPLLMPAIYNFIEKKEKEREKKTIITL